MARRRDWRQVGEVVEKIRELGLTLKEGAERFGVKVGLLYQYKTEGTTPPTGSSAFRISSSKSTSWS